MSSYSYFWTLDPAFDGDPSSIFLSFEWDFAELLTDETFDLDF